MIIVTTETISNKDIVETIGLVKGSTVRSKNLGKDILSGFKSMVGGELVEYNQMLEEARKVAISRMVEDAESKGADAIVGFRLMSSAVMQGAAEMVAYGTAVVVEWRLL